jgi:beta-lactamase regulating signal transducer with metallopeptidase domain
MSQRAFYDAFGQRLEIGQRIAYPVRRTVKALKKGQRGTHEMEIKSARIEALIPNAQDPDGCVIKARNPNQRPVTIVSPNRVIVLPEDLPQ